MTDKKEGLGVDFHEFQSDSDFLKQLNLSTFTTGTLYAFWYEKGPKGDFPFRQLFLDKLGDIPFRGDFQSTYDPWPFFASRYGITLSTPNQTQMEAWRFEDDNKGAYQLMDGFYNWTWIDPRKEITWGSFNEADLDLDWFSGYKVVAATGEGLDPHIENLIVPGEGAVPGFPADGTLRFLMNIVAMNDWVRYKEISIPDISQWPPVDLARREFIDDVKTSRSGCLSIPVGLNVDLTPERPNFCYKNEETTINLYLRDNLKDPDKKPFFVLPEVRKLGVREDSTGRPYGNKQDGDLTSPENNDQVAADVAMHYNEFTNTWQSGSKTIIAKITKTVGKAQDDIDIVALASMDIAQTLAGAASMTMGTGEAMPITMQNGNSFQWTPNYAQAADCRGADTTKAVVSVYNPDPDRTFAVGKVVLLNEVDGVWMPVEFSTGVEEDTPFGSTMKGKWEFQQFATNAGNFFCVGANDRFPAQAYNSAGEWIGGSTQIGDYYGPNPRPYGKLGQISPTNAEKIFHRRYYYGDPLNNGNALTAATYVPDPIKYAGNFDKWRVFIYDTVTHGRKSYCRQVTGMDYLEHTLGGNRGAKRSINRTVFGEYGDGSIIEDTVSPDNTLYFGVVFPDGYRDGANNNGPDTFTMTNRGWHGKAFQSMYHRYWDHPAYNTTYAGVILPNAKLVPSTTGEDLARTAYVYDGRNMTLGTELPYEPPAGPKICLFNKYVVDGETGFEHFPGDYATHSSPKGTYGRPITNMQKLSDFDSLAGHTTGTTGGYLNNLQDRIRRGFWKPPHGYNMDDNSGPGSQNQSNYGLFNWLYQEPVVGFPHVDDDSSKPKIYDYNTSAMDWRPQRINRIQFRPLTHELYCNDQEAPINPQLTGYDLPESYPYNRSRNYNYCTGKMNDGISTWGPTSFRREWFRGYGGSPDYINRMYANAGSNVNMPGVDPNDGKPSRGLVHGNDYYEYFGKHYHNSSRNSRVCRRGYAPQNTMARIDNVGGFLAVGVIGAVCTVEAHSSVSFTTKNKIGMISYYESLKWYPAWGGSSFDKYDKFGTTNLSVRIYQSHPRDNLIYDSRFFAVHHFNPGTHLPAERMGAFDAIQKDFVIFDSSLDLGFDSVLVDTDNDNKDDCLVDVVRTDVDVQVPSYVEYIDDCTIKESWIADPNNYVPTRRAKTVSSASIGAFIGYGHMIYGDSVWTGGSHFGRLLDKKHWNIDPRRRGKLLPYTVDRYVPQIPYFKFGTLYNSAGASLGQGSWSQVGKVWALSEAMPNYGQLVGSQAKMPALEVWSNGVLVANNQLPSSADVVLRNLGQGYKVGDKFKVDGFEKSEVTVWSTGVNGCVNGLYFNITLESNGRPKVGHEEKMGIDCDPNRLVKLNLEFVDPVDCADFTVNKIDYIAKATVGNAKFKPYNPFTVNGTGFDAYVVGATMRRQIITDHKPKIASASDFEMLSLNADNSDGGDVGQVATGGFFFGSTSKPDKFIKMTEGERIVSVDIDQNPSSSGLYDCFFHFHNDTSHTFLNNDNIEASHQTYDQYINLEVNPI